LKGYTKAFDTYVDFEEDTIFISDPVFVLQKPMRSLLSTKFANRVRHIAIPSETYAGFIESAVKSSGLCYWLTTILRKLKGLAHSTLALFEDHIDDHIHDSDSYVTIGTIQRMRVRSRTSVADMGPARRKLVLRADLQWITMLTMRRLNIFAGVWHV
jgi:hypothetical protein